MGEWGWQLLADRRWPVARAANIDMIAVGPGGVLVVDVKAWAEPGVRDGRLYRGDADAEDEVDTLLRMTETVEATVATVGLVASGVVPVLAGRRGDAVCVGRVRVVGERELAIWAARQPARISADRVVQLTEVLAAEFPPYDDPVPVDVPLPLVDPVPPRLPPAGEQQELVDVDALTDALLEAARAGTVEDWMTFLHPAQLALVRRNWSGAARIRGPAGTGKTAVALHRVAHLAATRPGPILVTTYVKTLPIVLAGVYRRLSPETADRVEVRRAPSAGQRLAGPALPAESGVTRAGRSGLAGGVAGERGPDVPFRSRCRPAVLAGRDRLGHQGARGSRVP